MCYLNKCIGHGIKGELSFLKNLIKDFDSDE